MVTYGPKEFAGENGCLAPNSLLSVGQKEFSRQEWMLRCQVATYLDNVWAKKNSAGENRCVHIGAKSMPSVWLHNVDCRSMCACTVHVCKLQVCKSVPACSMYMYKQSGSLLATAQVKGHTTDNPWARLQLKILIFVHIGTESSQTCCSNRCFSVSEKAVDI